MYTIVYRGVLKLTHVYPYRFMPLGHNTLPYRVQTLTLKTYGTEPMIIEPCTLLKTYGTEPMIHVHSTAPDDIITMQVGTRCVPGWSSSYFAIFEFVCPLVQSSTHAQYVITMVTVHCVCSRSGEAWE